MAVTRRQLIATGALSLIGRATSAHSLRSVTLHREYSENGHVLISVFLRGGVDSLNMVIPYADDAYHRVRPTIGVSGPTKFKNTAECALDLDGYFGLHPAMSPLLPLWQQKQFAAVHACGSGDTTHSHFEAMATMERGLKDETGTASGWLARHLQTSTDGSVSPLRAVALSDTLPESLRGAPQAIALTSVDDLKMGLLPGMDSQSLRSELGRMYGVSASDRDAASEAGNAALHVIDKITAAMGPKSHGSAPSNYPKSDFSASLHQIALLMKAKVGLEVACVDHGSYDTHVTQGSTGGFLAARLTELSQGIAAFVADIGPAQWTNTTILLQSEFGRRVEENSSAGTDHGHGGAVLVLSGSGIKGGHVYGRWPGIKPENLQGPGDLASTTDYRTVFAEVLRSQMKNKHVSELFPGLQSESIGIAGPIV